MSIRRVLIVSCGLFLAAACSSSAPAAIRVASLHEPIHSVSAEFVQRVLDTADGERDELVILEIDTPGGLWTSMKAIIQGILASRTPVCVWVQPGGASAASAGFLILISADVAAMSPGTNTGSAHPIFTGEETLEEGKRHILMEKVENDAAAFVRSLASNRGRNVELSERVVRESLNFTEGEALEEGLIDLVADDLDQLIQRLDGMEVRRFDGEVVRLDLGSRAVTRQAMTGRERALAILANPSLSFLLFALGVIGLYLEFTHPGLIVPGVVGAISLLLFGFSAQILPVNWVGLLLLACGVVLFVLEVKITSYGALTIGGIVCLFLGGLMLYDTPDIPEMRIPIGLLVAISMTTGLITAGLLALVVRAHRGKVETGGEGLVGEVGTVVALHAAGSQVFVHGETWNAVAAVPLLVGDRVRIVGLEGLTLRVEKLA